MAFPLSVRTCVPLDKLLSSLMDWSWLPFLMQVRKGSCCPLPVVYVASPIPFPLKQRLGQFVRSNDMGEGKERC